MANTRRSAYKWHMSLCTLFMLTALIKEYVKNIKKYSIELRMILLYVYTVYLVNDKTKYYYFHHHHDV